MPLRDDGELLDLVYDAAFEPALWANVMERIADLVGGSACWLSQIDVTDGSGGRADDPMVRADPYWVEQYASHYGSVNPFATYTGDSSPREFIRKWTPRVLTLEDQIAPEVIVHTEYYNDFLVPQDLGSGLMIRLAKSGLETATINISRSLRRDYFTSANIEFASALQPHLVRAFNLGRRIADERFASGALVGSSRKAGYAVFVLDSAGRVRRMNWPAETLIIAGRPLRIVAGRLTASEPDDARKLDGLIGAATTRDATLRSGGTVALASTRGPRPIAVEVSPITAAAAWPYHSEPGAVVLVSDLNDKAVLPEERLRTLFGLTKAETRLALTLLGGASPRLAAELFGVSFQTVRNQLVRIYDKTGVASQAELVGLLSKVVD
jgi:DNA-binding CsgD family transcriptional regulator